MRIFFLLILMVQPCLAEGGRFFYEGDGYLSIMNKETFKVFSGHYRDKDGTYNAEAIKKLNEIFQIDDYFDEGVSLRTLSFIDHLEDKFAFGKILQLNSGYRPKSLNEKIRKQGKPASMTSYHLNAMAADLIFPNTDHKKLSDYASELRYGGIGYYFGEGYKEPFVHVDSGRPRSWTKETAIDLKEKPPLNKDIYVSIDRDIYHPGETIRIFFSGVSNFPFGVKKVMEIHDSKGKVLDFPSEWKEGFKSNDCVKVKEPLARQITWKIPENFNCTNERLKIHLTFCNPKYSRMPVELDSREFEIRKIQ